MTPTSKTWYALAPKNREFYPIFSTFFYFLFLLQRLLTNPPTVANKTLKHQTHGPKLLELENKQSEKKPN